MQQKRLFIGAFIDYRFFEHSFSKIKSDFDKVSFGKWVEPTNLHFTMKFLGDADASSIPNIKESLDGVLGSHDCDFSISGLSVLPDRGLPRVLYAGIESANNIMGEHAILIESALEEFGFKKDRKQFFPHITLLRMKSISNDFRTMLKKYQRFEFGNADSFKIDLIESKLTSSGPVYIIL